MKNLSALFLSIGFIGFGVTALASHDPLAAPLQQSGTPQQGVFTWVYNPNDPNRPVSINLSALSYAELLRRSELAHNALYSWQVWSSRGGVQQLQDRVGRLEQSNDQLRQANGAYYRENERLFRQNKGQQREIDRVTAENDALKSEVADLGRKLLAQNYYNQSMAGRGGGRRRGRGGQVSQLSIPSSWFSRSQ